MLYSQTKPNTELFNAKTTYTNQFYLSAKALQINNNPV